MKKIKLLFFKFSPIDLLIILYQQTKFEVPSCYSFLRYPTYKIALLALKRGITWQGEIIQTRKKIQVSYFLTRNPYMKFQNPSLNFILNGRKDGRTNEQTHKPKPICSPLFQSWGHNDGRNAPLLYSKPQGHWFLQTVLEGFHQIWIWQPSLVKLDLMFMKHYAPNRCLYIKVAKLRTGVASAETSYLQNCSVKLFKEHSKVQICKERLFEKNKITFLLIFTN